MSEARTDDPVDFIAKKRARLKRQIFEALGRDDDPELFASVSQLQDMQAEGAVGEWARAGVGEIFAPLANLQWVCEGLELAPGAPTIIAGYGYSGKTVLAQAIALAVATGGEVGGKWEAARGRVVHLDFEQGARLTFERYQRLAVAAGIAPDELAERLSVVTFPSTRIDAPDAEEVFARELEGHALAIVDCYRAAAPSTDENSSEARVPLDMLARVSERTGCVTLVIHHARKTSEGDSDHRQVLRGSSALFDACQTIWIMSAQKGEPPTLEVAKARLTGRSSGRFVVRIEDVELDGDSRAGLRLAVADASEFDHDTRTAETEALMEALLEVVRERPGRSTRAVEQAARDKGVQGRATRIRAALDELALVGAIRDRNKGQKRGAEWWPLGPGGAETWEL